MAVSRLRSCERSFWHWTTMPVGRWVMRTAESAVLTPWPPGPEDRKTSTRISSSRTLTSTSSTSGTTEADAKLVCRRREASNGGLRGAGDQLVQPTDVPPELRALPDEVLGAAVVLPEGGRRHLGVEGGKPLLLRRNVKDAPGAR